MKATVAVLGWKNTDVYMGTCTERLTREVCVWVGDKWGGRGRGEAYVLSYFLLGLQNALYYVLTRTVVASVLGQDYGFIVLMAAMESLPGLLSVLLGFVSDKLGRRVVLLSGLLASLVFAYMGFTSVETYPIMALLYFTALMLYQSTLYGTVLYTVEGAGRPFSMFGLAGSLGWALGGLVPGMLSRFHHSSLPFLLGAASLAASSIIAYTCFPDNWSSELGQRQPSLRDLIAGVKSVSDVVLPLSLGAAGVGIMVGAFGVKLYSIVGGILTYGFIYSTLSGVFGAIARVPAGRLVDTFRPELVLMLTFTGYAVDVTMMGVVSGVGLVILWLLPLYPFYETSGYVCLSRRLPPNLQATAAGVFSTSLSISGLLNIASSRAVEKWPFESVMLLSAAFFISASVLLAIFALRRSKLKISLVQKTEKLT